jgi:glycosyltransferase involved in cell wall biosynthesis
MRVLHVVKTSEGAPWAARQAGLLRQLGAEVHVALPAATGAVVAAWRDGGAEIHVADLSFPVRAPHRLPAVLAEARRLVSQVRPDVIHTHFVTTACTLRLALGRDHPIPRVYQVAGPLHLEHWPSRRFELSLAGSADHWVGSSRCILERYRRAGVREDRLFLSYYGWFDEREEPTPREGVLRARVGASPEDVVVGNVNFMYPPKWFLGQSVGLKCHEDVIDALGGVIRSQPRVLGVFVGGVWGGAAWYEARLRRRARARAGDRIRFAGTFPSAVARRLWADFDLGIHVPLSENCGGVPEPLFAGVPVIASDVGGLPEVVMEGRTGHLVPPRRPRLLEQAILGVLADLPGARRLAERGRQLVRVMFDARRTSAETMEIYEFLLGRRSRPPPPFEAAAFVDRLTNQGGPAVADRIPAGAQP